VIYQSTDTVTIGYARRVSVASRHDPSFIKETWEFSQKAINILKEYQTRFPDFFDALEEFSQADSLRASEVFHEKPEQKVKEIQAWLSELGIGNAPLVPCGSQYLCKDAIIAVEREADKFKSHYDDARLLTIRTLILKYILNFSNST